MLSQTCLAILIKPGDFSINKLTEPNSTVLNRRLGTLPAKTILNNLNRTAAAI
jgi:hypothetical protein